VNASYGNGYKALMDAADHGKTDAVRVLLAAAVGPGELAFAMLGRPV